MGIIGAPDEEPIEQPQDPVPTEAFVEEVVDTQFVPASALLTHVAGFSWTVNFYQQFLTEGSSGTSLELEASPIHQQYTEIRGLVIKVDTPLAASQLESSGEFEVTGEAIVTPPLKPNKGDMFVGDIGDGRVGVFSIERVSRKSVFNDAVYTIAYKLTDYVTGEIEADLKSKTVKTVYYNEDFLKLGLNPHLVEEEHYQVEELKDFIATLIESHYVEFYNNEQETLLVPDDMYLTYDPSVVTAWNKLIANEFLRNRQRPKALDCSGVTNENASTIWDSLLRLDNSLLHLASIRSRTVPVKDFTTMPVFGSISLSGVTKVIWGAYELTHAEHNRHITVDDLVAATPEAVDAVYESPDATLIYPIDIDNYYVFSKPFYDGDQTKMSQLELQTTFCLEGKAMEVSKLIELVADVTNWEPIERFYYIPVLVVLMRAALRVF